MRPDPGGAQLSPTKPPPWHGWVVADMFLSSLSAGTFLVAAVGNLLAPATYGRVADAGYVVAFPLVIADLVCLVVDLGDPARFHHMLRMFKPRSPMSIGTWSLSLFTLISFVTCVLVLVPLPGAAAGRQVVVALGIPPALAASAYKGVLFSTTAQPGWKDARWLGAELAISSPALGLALALLIAVWQQVEGAIDGLRAAFIALLWLNLAGFAISFLELDRGSVRRLGRLRVASDYGSSAGLGAIVPLLLLEFGRAALSMILAASLTLLGALAFRRLLVMIPREVS